MLKSVRELEQFRVKTAEGHACGRIKDVYFDDLTWQLKHLVLSIEPSAFGRREVLLEPAQIAGVSEETGVELTILSPGLEQLPLASSVLPVCKQYEALMYGSPGARNDASCIKGDPHLRSTKAVMTYRLDVGGVISGMPSDFLYDPDSWEIRYLGVEQPFERKTMRFYVLPQSIERITWATQRVVLRELQPVSVDGAKDTASSEAA